MAIVKFISNIQCDIFVDFEYVGKVLVNEMLKVSLGKGCYLIEAKDDNGDCICKYKLNIVQTDIQLLEDISNRIINCHDEIIKCLKDDSTLKFHHHRALFCSKGKYGYINSRYDIVIDPIYTYAEDFIFDYSLVKKKFHDGEKATLIDIEGNISLECWYEYIGNTDETVLLKDDGIFYVLSKKDCSIIQKYYDVDYNKEKKLIPVYQQIGIDDVYGFIDKTGKEVIPFIYDHACNFDKNGLARVKRFGHSELVVDLEGNLYRNMEAAIRANKPSEVRKDMNSLTMIDIRDDYDFRDLEILSKEESVSMGFAYRECFENYYPFCSGNKWGLSEWKYQHTEDTWMCNCIPSNKITRYRCDKIIDYNRSWKYQYIVVRSQNICELRCQELYISNDNEDNEKCFSIEADEIIPVFYRDTSYYTDSDPEELNFLIIKRKRKYGIIDIHGKIVLDIDYDFIEPTNANVNYHSGDIAIIKKGGMFSLISIYRRKILLPFKYEEITPTYASSSYDSSYIVKENGKYGIIDIHGKIILPLEYDGIKHEFLFVEDYRHLEKSILQKGEKYGLWLREHYYINDGLGQEKRYRDLRIEAKYDECIFVDSANYYKYGSDIAVRCGTKWAVITSANMYKNFMNVLDDLEFKYKSLDDILYERTSKMNDRNLESVGFFNI